MKCAWQAYLRLLPLWMRESVDMWGREALQELRIRVDRAPEMVLQDRIQTLDRIAMPDDLKYAINAASQYSPWASTTIAKGYITAQGGHRIGISGTVAIVNGKLSTVSEVTSLCIRVARDIQGLAMKALELPGSLLIIGRPGSGKTTLLRDLARQKANRGDGAVAVVDERQELFPTVNGKFCFSTGTELDVLSGCSKSSGIEMMIRTMNPRWIVMDEITGSDDCQALIHAGWCGVSILATAHAGNMEDLMRRTVYKPLMQSGIFEHVLVMQPDKSWTYEEVNKCS